MICRSCGSEIAERPIDKAMANGYDPDIHCVIIKAGEGLVVACCDWLKYKYCRTCPNSEGGIKKTRTVKG